MNLQKKQKPDTKTTSTILCHLYQFLRKQDVSESVVEGYRGLSGVMGMVCILMGTLLT